MLLHVPDVLTADELAACRRALAAAAWMDRGIGAGESCEAAQLGTLVLAALSRHTTFFAGALPRHIFPPQFVRYRHGESSGWQVDNAIHRGGLGIPMRTDLSATLFLNGPEDYDGGALVIEDTYGSHDVKLAAGDLILYPASSRHRVEPVTRGEQFTSCLRIQSLVRDEQQRRMLLELDVSIQSLTQSQAPHTDVLRLTGIYHNLLRAWSET